MKVKELIEILQNADPESMILVSGYEGGYEEATAAFLQKTKFNVRKNDPHQGPHEMYNQNHPHWYEKYIGESEGIGFYILGYHG